MYLFVQLELLSAFSEGASLLERLRGDFVSALQREPKLSSADMFRGYLDLLRAVVSLVAPLGHEEALRVTAEQAALLSHLGASLSAIVGQATAPPVALPLLASTGTTGSSPHAWMTHVC